jgi:phage gp29-like protein
MASRQSSIVDSSGRPFVIETFDREIAGPTVTGVRRHPDSDVMRGITPQRMASILIDAKTGSPERYWELAEEMEERDPHYTSVLGTRKRAVAQLAVKVEASSASKRDVEIADTLRKWTRRKRLQPELFDMLDAVGKGISCCEIVWGRGPDLWMPARLVHRPMTWFVFDQLEKETPRLRTDTAPLGEELMPGKWLVHRHPAKTGLSVRSGIAFIVAWTVMFTRFSESDWIAFADTYGQPFRLGKYPPGTDGAAIRTLMHAVSMMGADAAAVVPDSMSMEIVQAAKSDGAMFATLASYFNRMKSKLVLGQETTTEAIAGGHAVSKEQNEVRGDIRDSDAVLVACTLQEQLVDVWTRINYGPDIDPPIISLDFEENEDVKATLDGAFGIADRGGKVSVKQLRDKLGLIEPAEGDELLGRSGIAEPDAEPADRVPGSLRSRLAATNATRQQIALAANAAATAQREAAVQDELLAALEEAGQPMVDGWLEQIRVAVNEATSLEDLAVRLLELYPKLETANLAAVIGQAMSLSNVSGQDLDA